MARLKRGDFVTAVLHSELGKPRPALIVQADHFNDTHATVTIAPVTTALVDSPLFRVTLEPSADNGLRTISQVMIDKLTSIRRERIGEVIGHAGDDVMVRIARALALWLGIGD